MNPFKVFQEVKKQYKSYIQTFQVFKDKDIEKFVQKQMDQGNMLWQEPIIQISKRFKAGKKLNEFVNAKVLHPDTEKVFKLRDSKTGKEFIIHPHYHQQQAIEIVAGKGENMVVTTGTGSGKSLCFEIPIVNYCLKTRDEGKKGIKAIIIYPMNALANSQYEELSKKLGGSGLKIGLYTGDTDVAPEGALEKYKDIFGPDAVPNDSEVISRVEMKKNPPDILLTNYVQLELLLTRLEDKPLFREEFKENLKFLVLDEIHTYSGKQGADVAFLIRRLKQRTNTNNKLICIGTSATMVSDKASDDSAAAVAEFASRMFGESFKPENVVTETEDISLEFDGSKISDSFSLVQSDIDNLDHADYTTAIPLFKAIMGFDFTGRSNLELGNALQDSKLLGFLEKELKEVKDFGILSKIYQQQIRLSYSIEECKAELITGLLLGIVGTLQTDTGKEVPRFIPKIHAFYNQGAELNACLDPACKYKSHTGETTCPQCENEERGIITLYPLHFCRVCGQEYYGMALDKNSGSTVPWTFMEYDAVGTTGYYSPDIKCNDVDLPGNWFTKVKKERTTKHAHKFPVNGILDTKNNKFTKYYDDENFRGVFIPSPLPICLNCSTEYKGETSEYAKLFLLNSVGRATGTDVITTSTINASTGSEKKLIGFSDNRQDTAFQAGHLTHWYAQIYFRRIFYKVLMEHEGPVFVKDLPAKLYPYIIEDADFPPRIRRLLKEKYETYLETFLYVEIRGTKKFTSINLEDVGLLEVEYDSLDESLNELKSSAYPILSDLESDIRYDMIRGFFEIFRREVAVGHINLIDKTNLRTITDFIDEHVPDKRIFEAVEETQVSIFTNATKEDFRKSTFTFHALNSSYGLRHWIRKCTEIEDNEKVENIINEIMSFGLENMYMREEKYFGKKYYFLDPDAIMVRPVKEGYKLECPKCHSQYNWKEVRSCLKNRCDSELVKATLRKDFYYTQYTQPLIGNQSIIADDHSAQVDGQERKIKENKFKKDPPEIQILFATPTMELGIDIGTLSSVYMRNVPPNPSNYAQRAGRAGRSGQGSIIQTFCGSGPGRGAHDQYFYNHTVEIVSGKISVPRFNLDNESLFLSHINALILQSIDVKFAYKAEEIIDFSTPSLELNDSSVNEITNAITSTRKQIIKNIHDAFDNEISSATTITMHAIESQIDNFTINLNESLNILRQDYKESKDEINHLTKLIQDEGQAHNFYYVTRRQALEKRNEDLRQGKGDFYMYRYLSQVGFLPNYAFPTKIKSVKFLYNKEERELVRDQIIAMNEFSPFNTLYYSGQKFLVERVSKESDINSQVKLIICEHCNYIEEVSEGKPVPSNCKSCGNVYLEPYRVNAIQFPRMQAQRKMRITAEEEERSKSGYKIIHSYTKSKKANCEELLLNNKSVATITFERTAKFKHVNLGSHHEFKEGRIGYNLDLRNRSWISTDFKKTEDYLSEKRLESTDISKQITLLTESKNDVITIEIKNTTIEKPDAFGVTLLNVLLQSISNVLNLDESEIRGYYQPIKDQNGRIIIFEASEGGTGTLSSIVKNKDLLHKIAFKALDILHYDTLGNDKEDACLSSCYNCICNFFNQRNHTDFDRKLVKETLLNIANFEDFKQSQDNAILFDEYCNDSKTSSLEKLILNKLHKYGVPMPVGLHKVIYFKNEPIVEADFYYDSRLCVFVDGPDHDKKHILEDDERKRKMLKMLHYKYLVIHHASIEKDIDNLILELGYFEDQINEKHFNGYIYLATSDLQLGEIFFNALKNLLDCFDFQFESEGKFISGSLKRRFGTFFKKVGNHFDPDEVFEKVKKALELKNIDKVQAEINKLNMEAASVFLNSVEKIPHAASYSGSLLILKRTINGEANIITRTLSTKEVLELDKNPTLCDSPLTLLDNLKKLTS